MDELINGFSSKKVVLTAALIATVLCLVFFFSISSGICSEYSFECRSTFLRYSLMILWAPVLLLFSVLTYSREKGIFARWLKVSLLWIILSSLVVLMTPIHTEGINWEALTALCMAAIFFVFSFAIVIMKK